MVSLSGEKVYEYLGLGTDGPGVGIGPAQWVQVLVSSVASMAEWFEGLCERQDGLLECWKDLCE